MSLSDAVLTPSVDLFPVVGVGASAGGLEAFSRLLRALSPTPGLALLLVQHLDPTHDSLLVDILGRETSMPVRQGMDGMLVEVNHVYVIPPDTRMGVEDGRIKLHPRGDRAALHMPVDFLFRSLAEAYGARTVAVVLSGSGTDGALGVADVRDAGGIAFAQDEASAGQPGMPASAAAALVDAVLPPEGIAVALLRLANDLTPAWVSSAEGQDPGSGESLAPLFVAIRAQSGIDFAAYKPSTIRRRVHRRMMMRGFAKMDELVRAVREAPAEAAALTNDLLIGVTRFFRDPDEFDRLARTTLPAILKERAGDASLRVWVPGCSTGEEAYSIAIAVIEAVGDRAADTAMKILATDVNEVSLARARTAIYPENVTAHISPERLRRFFRKADGGYRVGPAIRDLCVFARHDLAADPPFARMDLISCRNVLIYFDAGLQRRVIPLFHYALRPGGYLFLGLSETVGAFTDFFSPSDPEIRLYKRTHSVGHPHPGLTVGTGFGVKPFANFVASSTPPSPADGLTEIHREADRLLARYAPAGVVVDDNLNILQFRGETAPYLRHPHGTAGLDLLRMAREGLLTDLRDGIAEARAKNTSVRRPTVSARVDDSSRTVTLQIMPLSGGGELRCFLVLFEDEASPPAPADAPAGAPSNDAEDAARVAHLRRELEISREHQQAVAEEYEAANEELKSANEEILASNEELQSTNEELQTAKEELQSTNEELRTVNEEHEHRNRELERLNLDLRSLLVGVNVPVVVVDRDLRIRRLTAQAEAAFGMTSGDVGRLLRDASLGMIVPELAGAITLVIDSLQATEFEARNGHGRWFSFRVRPNETEDYRIDGVVVTAVDIDALKAAEEARRDLEVKMFQAQKLESLGVMAGGVAHDLNNLLTPVLGYAELALAGVLRESTVANYLGEIERATRLAAELVQQILAYSGKSLFELRTVDLSEFVRSLARLLTRAMAGKAELRLDLAATPLLVEADAAQLSQVILNLVTNAAEAAIPGRGAVTVRITDLLADRLALASNYLDATYLPEGRYAVLEVADTGVGMNSETLARLFDPFYTTKFTGRGLGLAAVLGIVRGHRGTIRVSSEPGLGSTFRVLLPITNRLMVAAVSPTLGAEAWSASGLALVVEENPAVRQLVAMLLVRAGFEVLQAADGTAALEAIRGRAADIRVVFIDLTMLGKGGLNVATEVRQLCPSAKILLISGYSEADVSRRLAGVSVDGFLHKPFTPGAVLDAVKTALGID